MTARSVQKSKQPVGCTTQGCSAGGCSLSSSGSRPGPQTRTEQHTWVQHRLPCSPRPSPQAQGTGLGAAESSSGSSLPVALHAAAHVTEKDEVRITQQRAAPRSLLSHLKKPTGHVAKRLVWLPRFLGTAQPSSAMLGSRKAARCSSVAEASCEQGPSTHRVSDPPNYHQPHPGRLR